MLGHRRLRYTPQYTQLTPSKNSLDGPSTYFSKLHWGLWPTVQQQQAAGAVALKLSRNSFERNAEA